MKELSPETFEGIKSFAEGLLEVFENYRKNHPDGCTDIILGYVRQAIVIHLELKELEVERYILNLKNSLDK